jgi:DNA-binding CsgD family transcriptional regulator
MSIGAEFEDFVTACRSVTSVDGLQRLFARFATSEGYENNVLTSIGEGRLKRIAWHEFPKSYVETYISNQWEREDPVLGLSLIARRPFLWNDVLKTRELTRSQKVFMAESAALKVRDGLTIPMHGPNGRCEIFSLSCRENADPDPDRHDLFRSIATQTWWKYVDLVGEATFDDVARPQPLTPAQRDVLLWIKDGKTNSEIAEIRKVSVKTVEYHVGMILDRLGATNRISAVVIALQRGLL